MDCLVSKRTRVAVRKMSGISATSAMLATARSKALFSTPPSGGALELSLSRRPAEPSRAAAVDFCIAMCANPAGRAPHTLLHSRTPFCFMVIDPVRTPCFQNTISAAIAKSVEVSPVRGTRTKAYCDLSAAPAGGALRTHSLGTQGAGCAAPVLHSQLTWRFQAQHFSLGPALVGVALPSHRRAYPVRRVHSDPNPVAI